MKYKLIQMYNLSKVTGLSEKTLKIYIGNYLLNKYEVDGRFCLCEDSMNILYSYLCKKGECSHKLLNASKTFKEHFPNARIISLEKL